MEDEKHGRRNQYIIRIKKDLYEHQIEVGSTNDKSMNKWCEANDVTKASIVSKYNNLHQLLRDKDLQIYNLEKDVSCLQSMLLKTTFSSENKNSRNEDDIISCDLDEITFYKWQLFIKETHVYKLEKELERCYYFFENSMSNKDKNNFQNIHLKDWYNLILQNEISRLRTFLHIYLFHSLNESFLMELQDIVNEKKEENENAEYDYEYWKNKATLLQEEVRCLDNFMQETMKKTTIIVDNLNRDKREIKHEIEMMAMNVHMLRKSLKHHSVWCDWMMLNKKNEEKVLCRNNSEQPKENKTESTESSNKTKMEISLETIKKLQTQIVLLEKFISMTDAQDIRSLNKLNERVKYLEDENKKLRKLMRHRKHDIVETANVKSSENHECDKRTTKDMDININNDNFNVKNDKINDTNDNNDDFNVKNDKINDKKILQQVEKIEGKKISIDAKDKALEKCREKMRQYESKITLVNNENDKLRKELEMCRKNLREQLTLREELYSKKIKQQIEDFFELLQEKNEKILIMQKYILELEEKYDKLTLELHQIIIALKQNIKLTIDKEKELAREQENAKRVREKIALLKATISEMTDSKGRCLLCDNLKIAIQQQNKRFIKTSKMMYNLHQNYHQALISKKHAQIELLKRTDDGTRYAEQINNLKAEKEKLIQLKQRRSNLKDLEKTLKSYLSYCDDVDLTDYDKTSDNNDRKESDIKENRSKKTDAISAYMNAVPNDLNDKS